MKMSGYKVHFSANINVRFICKSCGHLLRDAVQTNCGHHYCEKCLLEMLKHGRFFRSVKCLDENCSTEIGNDAYFQDVYMRREILQIIIPCLNKDAGCEWMGEVRYAEDHYEECMLRPVSCSNTGCSENVPLSLLAQHQEEECQFRDVICNFCNMAIKWADQANHLNESCENIHVTCGNCGRENIQLCELKRHQDGKDGDCTQKECPFRKCGCEHAEKMDPEQLRAHLDASVVVHSLLLLPQQRGVTDHCRETTTAGLSTLRPSLTADEKHIAEHDWALCCHYQMIVNLMKNAEKFDQTLRSHDQMIGNLMKDMQKLKGDTDKHGQ